jgi:hypothetical protein
MDIINKYIQESASSRGIQFLNKAGISSKVIMQEFTSMIYMFYMTFPKIKTPVKLQYIKEDEWKHNSKMVPYRLMYDYYNIYIDIGAENGHKYMIGRSFLTPEDGGNYDNPESSVLREFQNNHKETIKMIFTSKEAITLYKADPHLRKEYDIKKYITPQLIDKSYKVSIDQVNKLITKLIPKS